MTKAETHFHKIANLVEGAKEGNLFGKPCYKINGKAFCCFFQECMVFKLKDENHVFALKCKGAQLFDPSGKKRPMKEWVQLPYENMKHWKKLSASAADYVKG